MGAILRRVTLLVETVAEVLAHADAGRVAVLAPAGSARRRRFSSVLDALTEEESAADGLWVVALDAATLPAARQLARLRKRRLLEPASEGAWIAAVNAERPAAIALVGAPDQFAYPRLQALLRLEVPWSIVTGQDLAATTLMVAKCCLRPRQPSVESLAIDAFYESPTTDEVLPMIDRRTRVLSLLGHGEGGHFKLGDVVACGAVGVEASNGTPVEGGCSVSDNGHRVCKRAPDPNTAIVGFDSLKADILAIVTCNGFAIAGELYPSNASCVLAAIESDARAILAADAPVVMAPGTRQECLAAPERGTIRALLDSCNALQVRALRHAHFHLVGDPSHLVEPSLPSARDATVPYGLGEVTTAHGLRSRGIYDIEIAVRRHKQNALATDDISGALYMGVVARRTTFDEQLHAIRTALQRTQEVGDTFDVNAVEPGLTRLASAWDRAFASIVGCTALDEWPPLLLSPGPAEREAIDGKCQRCAMPLDATLLHGTVVWRRVECPICGRYGIEPPTGLAVELNVPPSIRPGESFRLEVGVRTSSVRDQKPWVVVELKDKGAGVPIYRRIANDWAVTLDVECPITVSPDLHSVEVVAVHQLQVTYARRRIVGSPRRSSETAARSNEVCAVIVDGSLIYELDVDSFRKALGPSADVPSLCTPLEPLHDAFDVPPSLRGAARRWAADSFVTMAGLVRNLGQRTAARPALEYAHRHAQAVAASIRVRDGAQAAFDKLRESGIRCAVVTDLPPIMRPPPVPGVSVMFTHDAPTDPSVGATALRRLRVGPSSATFLVDPRSSWRDAPRPSGARVVYASGDVVSELERLERRPI